MNYFILFKILLITIFLSGCKSESNDSANQTYNDNKNVKYRRYLVATRPGAYYPKGLRKLSVIEMKEMGEQGVMQTDFVHKDEYGKVVSKDYYGQGSEPRFIQMYVNENDVVVEGVVMEMSDEIRGIMNMMRFVTK